VRDGRRAIERRGEERDDAVEERLDADVPERGAAEDGDDA
jgi:hypothetical protein